MESLLIKLPFSSFPLRTYPSSLETGNYLTWNSTNLTPKRMPMQNLHASQKKWNFNQSTKLSAISDEHSILENELSLTNENSYAILLRKKFEAFCHLCRPYTIKANIVAVSAICLLPVQSIADLSPKFFVGYLQALVVATLNLIYINAMNQLFDIEVDKVNKGYLPLASGDLSFGEVVAICLSATVLGVGLGLMWKSPPLLCAAVASFVFGTGYSANFPFLRWKRSPLLCVPGQAIWCAFGLQIPFFIHIQKYVLGRSNIINTSFVFLTIMMCLLCIPQMLLKDIPDTIGDRENGITTLSTQMGEEKAFHTIVNILLAIYGFAILAGASLTNWRQKFVAVFGHLALALMAWNRSRSTDPTNPESAQSFYMFFWTLAGLENLVVHCLR